MQTTGLRMKSSWPRDLLLLPDGRVKLRTIDCFVVS
jgi:hypothetical protein